MNEPDKPKVFCKKCGVRLVDGARAKLCGFTVCLDLVSESLLAEKRIPKARAIGAYDPANMESPPAI